MKRIEMFSTVCLDTSCYSTWNYFSQGSCHITHKVPIEKQHCSSSTKPVQRTHKEGIVFILLPRQNHICLGTTRGKQFPDRLGLFFCSFLFAHLTLYQRILWAKTQHSGISAGGALRWVFAEWVLVHIPIHFESACMDFASPTYFKIQTKVWKFWSWSYQASGGQAIPATGYTLVIIRHVS